MPTIPTVRGAVEPSQLGVTLMHEHIFVLSTEIMQNFPEQWGDEEQRIADAVKRVNELKARGVTDEQLNTMLVEPPRKIFERQGAY